MVKYQKVEEAEVVSPRGHKVIQDELRQLGKTSARQLTEDERKRVSLAANVKRN